MRKSHAFTCALAASTCCLIAAQSPEARAIAVATQTHVYEMNEAAGARVMIDSGGAPPVNGVIGSEVVTGTSYDGAVAYRFPRLPPNTPPAHPEHLVKIPDDASLDPGSVRFSVEIRYRNTNKFGNLIQKGQATTAGGQVKIQLPQGRPTCYYKGAKGQVGTGAPQPLLDGEWHVLRCTRTASAVDFYVDGVPVGHKNGTSGAIANTSPWSVAGKTDCDQIKVTCDYFGGDVDYVRFEKG